MSFNEDYDKTSNRDVIQDFMTFCGFKHETSYSVNEISKITGEENNPFVRKTLIDDESKEEIENKSELISYERIYSYIRFYKSLKVLFDPYPEIKFLNQQDYFSTNYIKSLIVFTSICLWIFYFLYKKGPIEYKIAKGFGLNLRIWSIIMPILMCRSILMGKVEKHTKYHVLIGYIYLICTIGHTFAHFFNSLILTDKYISGIILTIIVLLISVSSIIVRNNKQFPYDLFLNIHRLSYTILPLLVWHMPDLWYWFFVGLFVLFSEQFYNFLVKTQISKLTNSRLSKYDNLITLSFHRAIPSVNGAFYRIMIPSISTEWHSFSLASNDLTDQLLFVVSVKGDWTRKLSKLLENNSDNFVLIQGPFYTCSTEILNDHHENILCIAGGIGIAPFISVLDTKVQLWKINSDYRSNYLSSNDIEMVQLRSYSPIKTIKSIEKDLDLEMNFKNPSKRRLNIIWIIREPQEIMKYINDVINISPAILMTVYITGCIEKNKNIQAKWFILRNFISSRINFVFTKPGIEEIILNTSVNLENHGDLFNITQNTNGYYDRVFYCGPDSLENDVKIICDRHKIPLKCEYFE